MYQIRLYIILKDNVRNITIVKGTDSLGRVWYLVFDCLVEVLNKSRMHTKQKAEELATLYIETNKCTYYKKDCL